MKVMITGCNGMLGTDLTELLTLKYHVTAVDVEDLDISNLLSTLDFVKRIRPDVIINCAAYTNVDGCEDNKDLAYKVNAIGPKNLAIASDEVGALLLHISTDYVFDGTKGVPYLEGAPTNPLSIYGKSKLDGEKHIQNHTNRFYILRTQWLYGKNGKNFVTTMLNLAKSQTTLKVVNDQFGSPTYTKDLCIAIDTLIETHDYGIYHVTNSGICTWYDFTKEILRQADVQGVTVNPCTTEEFPRPATRPSYSPLNNYNWHLSGREPLRDYRLALADYLKECSE